MGPWVTWCSLRCTCNFSLLRLGAIADARNEKYSSYWVVSLFYVCGWQTWRIMEYYFFFGTDFQLCVWSMDEWEKQASKFLQIPPGCVSSPHAQTRVQFHQDQIHVLAVHETQIAIYKAPKLEYLKQVCEALHNCPFKFSTLPAVREWTPNSFP